ncbi:SDR family oxidoreductase [Ammoniphilus sp. 3BR4]|uniref:SDR family oxidoreductase n=1 Tax=Ammoniphilus sp. 3BR4 TaxID=3158265 RepID=UPI0034673511
MKNVLIANALRYPALSAEIRHAFEQSGYGVTLSNAVTEAEINQVVADAEKEQEGIYALIYIPQTVFNASILDCKSAERIFDEMRQELQGGAFWLKAVGNSMVKNGIEGRIVILSHVTSNVPTQKFSYCSTGQAALNNLGRVAAVELAEYGIRTNLLVMGWTDTENQNHFVGQLRALHQHDKAPLLPTISNDEIAKMCFTLCDPRMSAVNGAMITLDGGFSVTRHIRKLEA